MNRAKVTIIVPAYNSEKTIAKCLASIFCQSYKGIQVIVINDGSSDSTLEICREISRDHENLAIASVKNMGVSRARNLGIEKTKTKYLTFVDADDTIRKNHIDRLLKAMPKGNALSICGYNLITKKKNYIQKIKKCPKNKNDFCNSMCYSKSISGFCWNKLYSTRIIKRNGIRFNEKLSMFEDVEFNTRYASHINKIGISREVTYNYDNTNSSLTKRDPRKILKKEEEALEIIKKETVGDVRYLEYFRLGAIIRAGEKIAKESRRVFLSFLINPKMNFILKTKFIVRAIGNIARSK